MPYERLNYRANADRVDIGTINKDIARGAYTATSPYTVENTESTIVVPTGLVSPAYGVAMPFFSMTGMTNKRRMWYRGVSGSYVLFAAFLETGSFGTACYTMAANVAATTTYCFSWIAFET